jgi:hypothetical protein
MLPFVLSELAIFAVASPARIFTTARTNSIVPPTQICDRVSSIGLKSNTRTGVLPSTLELVGSGETGLCVRAYASRQKDMSILYSGKNTMNRGAENIHSQCIGNAGRRYFGRFTALIAFVALALPGSAQASLFQGETLDAIANGISWVVLIIAPVIGIAVFWMVHILPEKIAEKRRHPQAKAIQCVCLLSLCFGGILWPLAWLWAYTKPVLHKMAYGTDVGEPHGHGSELTEEQKEIENLRARIAELEAKTGSGRA